MKELCVNGSHPEPNYTADGVGQVSDDPLDVPERERERERESGQ